MYYSRDSSQQVFVVHVANGDESAPESVGLRISPILARRFSVARGHAQTQPTAHRFAQRRACCRSRSRLAARRSRGSFRGARGVPSDRLEARHRSGDLQGRSLEAGAITGSAASQGRPPKIWRCARRMGARPALKRSLFSVARNRASQLRASRIDKKRLTMPGNACE